MRVFTRGAVTQRYTGSDSEHSGSAGIPEAELLCAADCEARDIISGAEIMQRAQAMAVQLVSAHRGLLKGQEPQTFERLRRTYFALDAFPENESRITVTYADVFREAHRQAAR